MPTGIGPPVARGSADYLDREDRAPLFSDLPPCPRPSFSCLPTVSSLGPCCRFP